LWLSPSGSPEDAQNAASRRLGPCDRPAGKIQR
jgi:hypothetical protein